VGAQPDGAPRISEAQHNSLVAAHSILHLSHSSAHGMQSRGDSLGHTDISQGAQQVGLKLVCLCHQAAGEEASQEGVPADR